MIAIDLSGKKALVTGAARGIGRASAIMLAEAGAEVAVSDILYDDVCETVAGMGSGFAIRCDLRDPDQISAMCDRALSELGGVDILVNCGAIVTYGRGIAAFEPAEWDRVVEVNLRGTYLTCLGLVENMKGRRDGRIINFSSLAAHLGGIETAMHYVASKAGVIGFTRSLAKECGPIGITVIVIIPEEPIVLPLPLHPRLLSDIKENSVPIISIEHAVSRAPVVFVINNPSVNGYEQVQIAIIIVVAKDDSHRKLRLIQPDLCSHLFEMTVPFVVI